ncbi:hypothetical protein DDN60_15615 [Vibrio cholerae]|nr:hypothetical protein [Vibrio cholerae]
MNSTSIFNFLNPLIKTSPASRPHKTACYIERIIKAIRTVTAIVESGTTPNAHEKALINDFFGYGKAAKAFEKNHPSFEELKQAFGSEDAFDIATKGVLHSFFTPDFLVKAMWRAVCRLGLTEGVALEPSCGTGQFIKLANPCFNGRFYGVELDPIVGSMARINHPESKIYINQRFEHAKLPYSGDFDLVITNPPWGNIKAHDQRFGSLSIHNYFALRGLSELREGGIMALVVSSWLMDSKNSETRQRLASMANLVAAVRLPNSAFSSESVSLPTDILIFQKSTTSALNPMWIEASDHPSGAYVNQLFINKPELVLGTLEAANLFDFNSCKVEYVGNDLENDLNNALDLQTITPCYHKVNRSFSAAKHSANIIPEQSVSLYELFTDSCEIYQRTADIIDENGCSVATYQRLKFRSTSQEKRVSAYIAVKDAMKDLLNAERANESKVKLAELRESLNLLHTGFVKTYGALSRRTNKSMFNQCSHYLRVKALEVNYVAPNEKDCIKESFDKAKILSKRVFVPFTPAKNADNYLHALSLSINELGAISVKRIAELMNTTETNAEEILVSKNMVFADPVSGRYIDSTTYLSGNVRQKLKQAEQMPSPNFERNITALKQVLPKDLSAEEITIVLGANWIDDSVYENFANKLMGENAKFSITYQADRWIVKEGGYGYHSNFTRLWGTEDRNFGELLQSAMNGTPIRVTRNVNGESKVDQEATAEAMSKMDEIVAEFDNWIWSEPLRRQTLTKDYNETFNCYVAPNYSELSTALTIEGCTLAPYDYQKKSILRGVLNPNTLFDCCVGSGKTLIFQSIAMVLKRLFGDAERPCIVMPNALVAQFSNTMSSTFPSSNVITLEAELTPEYREMVLNTAIVTDFDLLIVPESTFGTLLSPRDTELELIKSEIDELLTALDECEARKMNIKQIQKRIERKEVAMQELLNKPRLASVDWEALNITTLMVDEIQIFKNLPFTTTYSNIRGMGTPTGSKKAWDFLVKARATQNKIGRVIGGTGSSLSNSITEAVSWMKVFAPELKDIGLHRVDSFIRQFSNPVTEYSLAATGRTLKSTTTLKRFQNLSELLSIYRNFAEVLSNETLEQIIPTLPDGRPAIPPLKGGKIDNEILPISEAQELTFQEIVNMANNINKQNNMLKIIDMARKASLDIRHIDPYADNKNNVVNAVCESVYEIFCKTRGFKGTQLIFSDRSCPSRHKAAELKHFKELYMKAENGDETANDMLESYGGLGQIDHMLSMSFSIYDEIETILSKKGLNVAVVHDFKTDIQKNKLKADFNAGNYDVILGSTSKLGTGWNINERLVAVHHADLPLRPGDFEQRNGRIRRQQNQAYIQGFIQEIIIKTYSTERTLDSWFAALLDRKATFIKQFNNGTLDTREYEVENEQIDFATLSALVSGDPKLLELVKAQQELKRFSLLERSFKKRTYRLQDDLRYFETQIHTTNQKLTALQVDEIALKSFDPESICYRGMSIKERTKVFDGLLELIQNRRNPIHSGTELLLYSTDGFELIAKKTSYFDWSILLRGTTDHFVCDIDSYLTHTSHKLANKILNGICSLKNCYKDAVSFIRDCEQQLSACRQELIKPFKHEYELVSFKSKIKILEAELAESKAKKEATTNDAIAA